MTLVQPQDPRHQRQPRRRRRVLQPALSHQLRVERLDGLALVQRQASRLQRDGESEQVDAEVIAAAEHTAADAGEQVSQDSLPLPLLSARGNVGSMSYVGILYIFFWSLGAITP